MRFADINPAIGGNQYVIRLSQVCRRIAHLTRRTDGHQQFSFRAEFQYRATVITRSGVGLQFTLICQTRISNPDIAFSINIHAMGPDNLTRSERGNYATARIQFYNRIDVAGRAGIGATSITCPDMDPIYVDIHGTDRTPSASIRQRAKIALSFIRIG